MEGKALDTQRISEAAEQTVLNPSGGGGRPEVNGRQAGKT